MLAADLYEEFDEVGFEDKEKLAHIGKRLLLIIIYDALAKFCI